MSHIHNVIVAAILCLIPTIALLSLVYVVPAINAWERANGYPYGKMCNSVFTFYVDTCKR